jgi:hypothetical protein
MTMVRLPLVGLLAGLALAVSACGGEKRSADLPAGAELAPASAPVYIDIATDPNGSQWKAVDRLLRRFPGRGKLLAELRKELTKEGVDWNDIKPALPEELHVVWFDFENDGDDVVGYAKPKDEAKFVELLETGDEPLVHTTIEGWTVFTDKQAVLDRFEQARSSGERLSDVKAFRDAAGDLPADAAVRGWVSGKAIYDEFEKEVEGDQEAERFRDFTKSFGTLEYLTFSAAAEEAGVRVEAGYKTDKEQNVGEFSPELDDALPGDALLYLSFGNLEDFFNSLLESADESFPEFQRERTKIEKALGFTFKGDLFPLFSKEGAIAVYHEEGKRVPNVLFVLRVDEEKATKVIERLAALAELNDMTVEPFEARGHTGQRFAFPYAAGFFVYAVAADGMALVSNGKAPIERTLGDEDKLTDDAVYKDARRAAEAPDDTVGFVYLNLAGAIPYINELLSFSGSELMSPEARANTKPLESVFLFAAKDGERVTLSGFLTIK